MFEYTCMPRRRDKTAYLAVLAAFVLAIVFWGVSRVENVPFPVVFQLGTFASLAAALWLSDRFLLRDYTYAIRARDDGGFDFIVTERRGKRLTCLCRIGTETFTALTAWDKTARDRYRTLSGRNWRNELRAGGDMLLELRDGEEEVGVRFTPDETLTRLIRHALDENL